MATASKFAEEREETWWKLMKIPCLIAIRTPPPVRPSDRSVLNILYPLGKISLLDTLLLSQVSVTNIISTDSE